MSFKPDPNFDKKNHDFRQKCIFVLSQIKVKDSELYEKLYIQLLGLKTEDTHQYYLYLVTEYQKLSDITPTAPTQSPVEIKKAPPTKPMVNKTKEEKKKVPAKKESKKEEVKEDKKKAEKKIEKKKPTKSAKPKVEKKPASKTASKKTVKKVAKKTAKKKSK
jgi:hypothetical protein